MLELSAETEALVLAGAARAGKSADDLVREAVLGLVARRLPEHVRRPIDHAALQLILARCAQRPIRDDRSPEDIIGFDEVGVPR